MAVKKSKTYSPACHKIFMGILLIIAGLIFWYTPDFKDAWMYTFFIVGILFLLKGIYISSK